jgi:hypothetical protein
MATRTPKPQGEAPQPTHGGVYELVDGQLKVIEGGPPTTSAFAPAATNAPAPQADASIGEGA